MENKIDSACATGGNFDRNRYGFTLLEILLGISIFSLIALSVYSTFSNALQIQHRTQNITQAQREARFVLNKIGNDIENMLLYGQDQSNHSTTVTAGEADQLTLFSFQKTGLKIVTYYLGKEKSGSIKETVVGETVSKLRSVTVSRNIEEQQGEMLIRQESPIGFSSSDKDVFIYPSVAEAQEKDTEDILSDQIQSDGLHFYYAQLEKSDGDQPKIVWQQEMKADSALLGIRVELAFLPSRKDHEPLTLSRDILLPQTASLKL